MKKILLLLFTILTCTAFSQSKLIPVNGFQQEFLNAYSQYPDVPKGVLEAVS